MEIIKLEDEIK